MHKFSKQETAMKQKMRLPFTRVPQKETLRLPEGFFLHNGNKLVADASITEV
jgi:hypothetical protein